MVNAFFTALSLLFLYQALGQDRNFIVKNYSPVHGLAHASVKCLARDSSGFLWIGTFDGLSRFDGNDFTTYRHSPDDSTSLASNEVTKLVVDKRNQIWVLSSDICRFDRGSESFRNYRLNNNENIVPNPVYQMTADHRSELWAMRHNELLWYDQGQDLFIRVPILDHFGKTRNLPEMFNIYFDERDVLWIMTPDGIEAYRINAGMNSIPIECLQTSHYTVDKEFLRYIFQDHPVFTIRYYGNDTFLLSSSGGLVLESSARGFVPIPDKEEEMILKGSSSFAWLNSDQEICTYDALGNRLFKAKQEDLRQMSANLVDEDGSVWLTGIDHSGNTIGLRHIIPLNNAFHHYFESFKGRQTSVYAIWQDTAKDFWVGFRSKEYAVHLNRKGIPDRLFTGADQVESVRSRQKLLLTHTRSITRDNLGNIWFGFLRDFVFINNRDDQQFRMFLPEPQRNAILGKRTVNRLILNLKNGYLLIGGDAVIYLVDPEKREIVNSFPLPVANAGMYAVFQDEKGSVWTGNGSSILRKFSESLVPLDSIRLTKDVYNLEGITGNSDTLWIASMGGGLIRYIPKTRASRSYTTRDGLPHNYTYHLFEDGHRNLWISTNDGISMFNPATGVFTNYNETDGLKIREFNADAGFKADDGEMFFGGIGGFAGFYPDSLYRKKQRNNSLLYITSISVSGIRRNFPSAVSDLDTCFLKTGENNIQLTFSLLEYSFPEKVNYRYRLEGIDGQWNLSKPDGRRANYAGLTPGWYRFVVEASDQSGAWAFHRQLVIRIPAYYYQTAWFKVAVIFMLLMIITIFARMKYLQYRMKNLKQQETLRLQSLQSQLNPHFIFNALNSVSYLISHRQQEIADQYVADFASLMRNFLDNSTRDFILLREEIESIERYLALEHLRLKEKFDYRVEYESIPEIDALEVVPSLIQPFVENAIWHGVGLLKERKGNIVVTFTRNQYDRVTCMVEDNGIGRKRSSELKSEGYRQRQSKGISLIRQRLEIINSLQKTDFRVLAEDLHPDRAETGTRVIIPLPVRM